jgi:hypothetical protein
MRWLSERTDLWRLTGLSLHAGALDMSPIGCLMEVVGWMDFGSIEEAICRHPVLVARTTLRARDSYLEFIK